MSGDSASGVDYGERIKRLARLQGSDPGFTVLAVHSFAEAYAREQATEQPSADEFMPWLAVLRQSRPLQDHNLLSDLNGEFKSSHKLTNSVRHTFANLTDEDVRAQAPCFRIDVA